MAILGITGVLTTRILGPEKLGISGVVISVTQQLALLLAFIPKAYAIRTYKSYATPEESTKFAGAIFRGTFRLVAGLAAIVYIAVALGLVPSIWCLATMAAVPLLIAITLNPAWVHQSHHRQVLQYKNQFGVALVGLTLTITFLYSDSIAGVDLLIAAISSALGTIHLWLVWSPGTSIDIASDKGEVSILLGHLKKARLIYFTGICTLVYTTLELPLIGIYCGNRDLGLYRSAVQWAALVQGLLSVVPLVLYPKFIELRAKSDVLLWEMQLRFAKTWSIIGCVSILLLSLSIGVAYPMLFGEQFVGMELVAQLLTASRFVVVLNGIFCWGLWAKGDDRSAFLILAAAASFSIASNILLLPRYGMLAAAVVNLTSEIIVLVGSIVASRPSLGK
jgi:O-antigen/teichoic acid export membrane protein